MKQRDTKSFESLLEKWEQTVKQLETGYTLTMDDYLNDLDVRQSIHQSLRETGKLPNRLQKADDRFRAATKRVRACLWGEKNQRKHKWTAKNNWWYFSRPLHGELAE